MMLEWYEWECPYCRRIGQVDPTKDYEDGETMRMRCPVCGGEVVVLCDYQPTFFAYRPKNWTEDATEELKPCPFCGSNAETVHTLNMVPHEPWWIRCPSCGVTTQKHSSETDAIAAWNRRTE